MIANAERFAIAGVSLAATLIVFRVVLAIFPDPTRAYEDVANRYWRGGQCTIVKDVTGWRGDGSQYWMSVFVASGHWRLGDCIVERTKKGASAEP